MYIDIDKLVFLIESGLTIGDISIELSISKSTVKRRMSEFGLKSNTFLIKRENIDCLNCNTSFNACISENRKFCSNSCSAMFNNKLRGKIEFYKKYNDLPSLKNNCFCVIQIKSKSKFCSRGCYEIDRRNLRYKLVEDGIASSKICKNYLIEKYGEKCMECGWNKINEHSMRVPIEIEHIDGNSENNNLGNLKLLCPNCHSLTPTYKALNVGNGRKKRMDRYYKDKK